MNEIEEVNEQALFDAMDEMEGSARDLRAFLDKEGFYIRRPLKSYIDLYAIIGLCREYEIRQRVRFPLSRLFMMEQKIGEILQSFHTAYVILNPEYRNLRRIFREVLESPLAELHFCEPVVPYE